MQQLSEEGRKAKLEYIDSYRKEHYKQFSAVLKKEEWEEITEYLQKNNMTKSEFVRYAYECLLNGRI